LFLTAKGLSSKILGEHKKSNLGDPSTNVFFDVKLSKSSSYIVSYPASMTFAEIALKIVESYKPSARASQLIFKHRNIPNSIKIEEQVNPIMFGLEGSSRPEGQPGGPVKATLGYRLPVTVDKKTFVAIVLDLNEEVGSWVKGILDVHNQTGLLYVNSQVVSSRDRLTKAFVGLIDEDSYEIRGNIIIKVAEDCTVTDTDGRHIILSISQRDTLDLILNRIDMVFPDAEILEKKTLCINPKCDKTMTEIDAPFGKYDLKDYQNIYIPGPIKIRVKQRKLENHQYSCWIG